jgi:hypothetical protein
MGPAIKVLALVVALIALVFLLVGLSWTEWPQTIVGLVLALAAGLLQLLDELKPATFR